MNHRLLLLSMCVAMAAGTNAQIVNPSTLMPPQERSAAWDTIDRQVMAANEAQHLMKTTSGQRLLNLVTYNTSAGAPSDSQAYVWSGNRELPHYKFPIDIYDEGFYEYDYYAPLESQPFDVVPRYLRTRADTVMVYGGGQAISKFAYQHDADNEVVRADWNDLLNTFFNQYRDFDYNAAGKITKVSYYYDDTDDQIDNYHAGRTIFCSYDASGWLVKDSSKSSPTEYNLTKYYNDAAGRDTQYIYERVSPTLPFLVMRRFYYTPAGLLDHSTLYNYNSDSATYYLREADSFAYDGINSYPIYHLHRVYDSNEDSTLVAGQERSFTLNAAGDVQHYMEKFYSFSTGNWDNNHWASIYYNSYNNADSVVIDRPLTNGGPVQPRTEVRYYRYGPVTNSVSEAPVLPVSIGVYPNPAGESITLSTPSSTTGMHGCAMIYDMQGRLAAQRGIVQAHQRLDVSGLTAGMYFVRYTGADGSEGVGRFVKE